MTTFQKAVETPQSPPDSFLQDFGHQLYQALFPEPIQTAWEKVLKSAPRNQPVHLRLRIDPEADGRWGRLPWEYLHDGEAWFLPRKGLRFSRLAPGVDERPFPKLDDPLRLLIMVCAPHDQPEHRRLNARVEEDLIQQATLEAYRSGELEVYFAPNGRLDTLQDQLQTVQPHILHLSTHGGFDGQTGRILMETPEGQSLFTPHEKLIETLAQAESLRMAVFSACQTARVSATSGFSDLGRRLLAEVGLGAVAAMAFSVSERGANAFISRLYHEAVKGIGLDAAAARARRAIPEARELGTPVLYLADPGALQLDPDGVRKNQKSYPLALDALGQHPTFVGRSVELHSLQTHLDPQTGDAQAAVIYGPGGMGKTALVRRMAVRSFGIFQGALALRMAPQTTVKSVLDAFRGFLARHQRLWGLAAVDQAVSVLNQPPEKVKLAERMRCLAEALAALPLLVIVDNCEDILPEGFHLSRARQAEGDADAPVVDRALLGVLARLVLRGGGPGGSRFIFTSRMNFSLADLADDAAVQEQIQQGVRVLPLELKEFGFRESLFLMDALPELRGLPIRRTADEQTQGLDPLTRLTLSERIGGHPYYLHLFDRRAAQMGGAVAAWQALPELEKEMLQHTLLAAAIESLPERARALLKRGSVIQTPTPPEGWAFLLGDETDCMPEVTAELDALQGSGLVMAFPEGGYQPYTLAAQRVRAEMDEDALRASQARLGDFWWVRGKETHAMEDHLRAWEYRMAAGEAAGAYEVFAAVFPTLHRWGQWDRCRRMGLALLPKLSEAQKKAALLHNLGVIEQAQGRFAAALDYYERALAIKEELGDRGGVAITLHQLGMIEQDQGRYAAALEYYERSLAIKEALGNRGGVASTLHQLGMIEQDQGRFAAALDYYERSLAIFEDLEDQRGVASTLHQLGIIEQDQGRYKAAVDYYERSLAIKEELGNRGGVANSLGQLGRLAEDQGDLPRAVHLTGQAFMIFNQLGFPHQGISLRVLARLSTKLPEDAFFTALAGAVGEANAQTLVDHIKKNQSEAAPPDAPEADGGDGLEALQAQVMRAMTSAPQTKAALWQALQTPIQAAKGEDEAALADYLGALQALLEGWPPEKLNERVPEGYQAAWESLVRAINDFHNQE